MHIKLEGLIPIFGGIYGLFLAYRVVPRKPRNPEKMESWHRKFGTLVKILSPFLIGFWITGIFWSPMKRTITDWPF